MKSKKLKKAATIAAVAFTLILTLISQVFAETGGTTGTTSGSTSSDGTTAGWVQMAPMATGRSQFGTVEINGKIYSIGGRTGNSAISSVEEYDSTTNTWTTKAPLSDARYGFLKAMVNGKIYVLGGDSSSSQLFSIEEYDPATDVWAKKASIPSNVSVYSEVCDNALVLNGEIYFIANNKQFFKFSPTTNTCVQLSPMLVENQDQAIIVNNNIYAFGSYVSNNGIGSSNAVEKYDPSTNKWTMMAPMTTARWEFGLEMINGKVYVIGGYNMKYKGNVSNSVEEYDPETNTWTTKAPIISPMGRYQTVVTNNKIYALSENKAVCEYDTVNNTWTMSPSMSENRSYFQSEVINGTIYAIGGLFSTPLTSVEAYQAAAPTPVQKPTLTVTPSASTVKLGSQFTTTVAIHGCTNICAEDIKLTYDTNLFEYVSATAKTGLGIQKEDSTTTPGTLRFIVSSLGKDNVATGDKDLIDLTFKAKAPGQGKVDIIKGRIADNATLEMDVPDADCGETTITVETNKDVNRSGEVTLLDLGIDGWYYGMKAQDTDSTKYDADVVPDGTIDGKDLTEVTAGILANPKYPNN